MDSQQQVESTVQHRLLDAVCVAGGVFYPPQFLKKDRGSFIVVGSKLVHRPQVRALQLEGSELERHLEMATPAAVRVCFGDPYRGGF